MSLEGCQLGYYQLLRQIGRGGMNAVYLAQDTHLPRQVAVKVLRTDSEGDGNSEVSLFKKQRFQHEVNIIAQLDHPSILPLFDSGESEIYTSTYLYLVMPYRTEGSLADWLRQYQQSRPLTAQEVGLWIMQAAQALQYAHEHQIVHQDVKPSNFLLRSSSSGGDQAQDLPDLLLADFGLAQFLATTYAEMQNIGGTPSYMAPEQWEGRPVPASDQYALAVMAFQLLTGQFPFQGTPGQVMYQHHTAEPPLPSSLNTHLSPAIDAVIARALSKQTEQRFPSIRGFAHAFLQALDVQASALVPAIFSRKSEETVATPLQVADIPTTLVLREDAVMLSTVPQAEVLYLAMPQGASPSSPSHSPWSASTSVVTPRSPGAIDRPPARNRMRSLLVAVTTLLLVVGSGVAIWQNLPPKQHVQQMRIVTGAMQQGTVSVNATAPGLPTTGSAKATGVSVTPAAPVTTPSAPGVTTTPTPTPSPTAQPLTCSTYNWSAYLDPSKGKTFLDPVSSRAISTNCHNAVLVNFLSIPSSLHNLQVEGCVDEGSCGAWIGVTSTGTWITLKSMPPGTVFWLEITYTDSSSSSSTLNITVEF